MSQIFVLLFNAHTDNEGIHTLQIGDRHKVLMFEDEDEATRFALMLEAQDFPPVTVEAIEEEDILEFCREADYDWERIEPGQLLVPPENTIPPTDWNPEGKTNAEHEDDRSASDIAADELERIRRQLEGLL